MKRRGQTKVSFRIIRGYGAWRRRLLEHRLNGAATSRLVVLPRPDGGHVGMVVPAQPADCGHESCDCDGYCKRAQRQAQPAALDIPAFLRRDPPETGKLPCKHCGTGYVPAQPAVPDGAAVAAEFLEAKRALDAGPPRPEGIFAPPRSWRHNDPEVIRFHAAVAALHNLASKVKP